MKTGIITFEDYHKRKDIGSSRIRGFNIAACWEKAGPDLGPCEPYRMGVKYDAVIYQKVYWVEHAKHFKGFKILDMCDPDFLHWGYPIQEMLAEVDIVTVSSPTLLAKVAKLTPKPVYLVPDGILVGQGGMPTKLHSGPAKKVAWYGYSENFPLLDAAIPAICELGLELIVIAPKPYMIVNPLYAAKVQITNYPWSANWQQDLQKADVVINPRQDNGRWLYKSNNKTLQAWALGLPVAANDTELKRFLDPAERSVEVNARQLEVQNNWLTENMVALIKGLIVMHKK